MQWHFIQWDCVCHRVIDYLLLLLSFVGQSFPCCQVLCCRLVSCFMLLWHCQTYVIYRALYISSWSPVVIFRVCLMGKLEALGQCILLPRHVLPVSWYWSGSVIRLPPKFNHLFIARCQPSMKISCKSVPKFLCKVADRQTDEQRRLHILLGGSNNISADISCPWALQITSRPVSPLKLVQQPQAKGANFKLKAALREAMPESHSMTVIHPYIQLVFDTGNATAEALCIVIVFLLFLSTKILMSRIVADSRICEHSFILQGL